MHRVAYTSAGTAEPHAELSAGAEQKHVIVGITEVGLQEIMIDALDGQFRSHPRNAHCLEFQHHQRSGGVLCQGLVYLECDLRARHPIAL